MAKPAAQASHHTNLDLIIGLRVFCSCGCAQKTSLRFLSNLLLGKNRVSWSVPYGLIGCADNYRQNVQGSSTARKINRPLERDVTAWPRRKAKVFLRRYSSSGIDF